MRVSCFYCPRVDTLPPEPGVKEIRVVCARCQEDGKLPRVPERTFVEGAEPKP